MTKFNELVEVLQGTGLRVYEERAITQKLGYIILSPLIAPDVYVSDAVVGKKVSYQVAIFNDKPLSKRFFFELKKELAQRRIVCNGESGGFQGEGEYFHYYFTARYFAYGDDL